MPEILILKSNGQTELFDPAKLTYSLTRSGASDSEARSILLHIQKELVQGMTTNEIYRHAFDLLRGTATHAAIRYSLKRALAELGPTGFPFEKFVAEIFKAKGYEAVTGQMVQGGCVEHEMDVVAWNDTELSMSEVKFHNEPGIKSDLKVALYVKARFDDLKDQEFTFGGKKRKLTKWSLITNTKFTDHAIRYAECQGLPLIGWNYPRTGNLEDLIEESGLHPVTALTSLSNTEKKTLLDAGIVLCRQLQEKASELPVLGVHRNKMPQVLDEVRLLCK